MKGPESMHPIVATDHETLARLYPKKWVGYEVVEEKPGVGDTKGRVIAAGTMKAKDRVVTELVNFREKNPDRQIGLIYTGPFLKPGQDAVVSHW